MSTDTTSLFELLAAHRHGVLATLGPDGAPQAATVGYAVSDRHELVFDTLATSRKGQNIRRDARVAFVVTEGEQTFQLEGIADEPRGEDRDRLVAVYLAAFPDGLQRQAWPDLIYVRISVRWLRYSDYRGAEPLVVEKHVPSE